MSSNISGHAADAPMTMEAWGALAEDVDGELVDGRLEDEEMGSFVHELVVLWLGHVLRAWIVPQRGFVFGADAKFAVRPTRGRKPDLSVFLPGTTKPPRTGVGRTPSDVMIEVITPTPKDARRDRIDKLVEYAGFGVRFYWLVDPELLSLEILERGSDGRYTHALDVTAGRITSVPGCDGLVIDLDQLWLEVAQLDNERDGSLPTRGRSAAEDEYRRLDRAIRGVASQPAFPPQGGGVPFLMSQMLWYVSAAVGHDCPRASPMQKPR